MAVSDCRLLFERVIHGGKKRYELQAGGGRGVNRVSFVVFRVRVVLEGLYLWRERS